MYRMYTDNANRLSVLSNFLHSSLVLIWENVGHEAPTFSAEPHKAIERRSFNKRHIMSTPGLKSPLYVAREIVQAVGIALISSGELCNPSDSGHKYLFLI